MRTTRRDKTLADLDVREDDSPMTNTDADPPLGALALSFEKVADGLRSGAYSALELTELAIRRHTEHGERLHAYKTFDAEGARVAARTADDRLASEVDVPPFCGIPVSVKDLYGAQGLPTFAGTARALPESWTRDAWLVARLREQGAVIMGKTHTVELAYGAVGLNPHWGAPLNPWDDGTHRITGGSSAGAGVSLWEGSALLALGSDTGGSIRIPAAMTGTVGHKLTHGRWSVDGVVPLSTTLDTVGALTRSVDDAIYFFGSIDPLWGDPQQLRLQLSTLAAAGLRVAVPDCTIWDDCQTDMAEVLHGSVAAVGSAGWSVSEVDGGLLDEAQHLYMTGGIAGAECLAFLHRELPEWIDILDPIVGSRLVHAPALDSDQYRASMVKRGELMAATGALFEGADVLALPASMATPAPVADLADLDRYGVANVTALRPTCPISMLGLCAITLPVGQDAAGMPVGLQLVAPGGQDEALLGAALAVERVVGGAPATIGRPSGL
jgi:aspartyl-tRNA(Asn)/glutamyl-tRNA(Gln) amidotransferase subunit A